MSSVLVTGGSGFVSSHVVLQLLNAGHSVRTTVRSLKKEESVRAMLRSELSDWIVRAGAIFDPAMRQLLPMLEKVRNATSAKARRVLGWKPRSREDAIVATAESLLRFGIV